MTSKTAERPRADEPPPRWTKAPGLASLNPENDLPVLREVFDVGRLPVDHPVRVWWSSDAERFTLHHLADDIRTVRDVPGAKGLAKLLRSDKDGFEDFRYELRMAASAARSEGQQLVQLAGSKPGPDFEFIAKSRHRCGVACYRGRTTTGGTLAIRAALKTIAEKFLRCFIFKRLDADLLIDVVFPEIPLRPSDVDTTADLLREFWLRLDIATLERDGIRVQRVAPLSIPARPGQLRRSRIRFLLPLRAAERKRILRHLRTKVPAEIEKWAATYGGVPLLAIEESEGIHNGSIQGDIAEDMKNPGHTFAGVLLTYYPEQGVEMVDWIPRQGDGLGLHVGIETFGMNFKIWAADRPAVSFTPDDATEEWDFVRTAHGCWLDLIEPFSLHSRHALMPRLKDPTRNPTEDPDFLANLRKTATEIVPGLSAQAGDGAKGD